MMVNLLPSVGKILQEGNVKHNRRETLKKIRENCSEASPWYWKNSFQLPWQPLVARQVWSLFSVSGSRRSLGTTDKFHQFRACCHTGLSVSFQTYGAACRTSPYDTSSCYASDCWPGLFHLGIWNKYVITHTLEVDIRWAVVQSLNTSASCSFALKLTCICHVYRGSVFAFSPSFL